MMQITSSYDVKLGVNFHVHEVLVAEIASEGICRSPSKNESEEVKIYYYSPQK